MSKKSFRNPDSGFRNHKMPRAKTLETFVHAAIEAKAAETGKKSRRRRKTLQPKPVCPEIKPARSIPTPATTRCKRRLKLNNSIWQSQVATPKCTFRARGLVTVNELQDKETTKALQRKIQVDFSRFGQLQSAAMFQEEDDRNGGLIGDVVVVFHDANDAASAFRSYDGVVVGEKMVMCFWETQGEKENQEQTMVTICGILTSEEVQDPDELADVEEEMMQIFCNHGTVNAMQISKTTGDVTVTFADERVANKVVQLMNGSRYGGRLLTASRRLKNGGGADKVECANVPHGVESKRVAAPIVQLTEFELQDLVGSLLKRLTALQGRAHTQKPRHDKRSRRLVLGMHEVRRGLLRSKILLLIIATDLDECEAVEEKHAELVSAATEQKVPILVPMNRRKLGRSLQKSVRVSCVGVYSVEGANDLFQQILHKISQ